MFEGQQLGGDEAAVRARIRRKLVRIARGHRPRVLDLFSGCGGMSLGFQRAGFKIVGNVEINATAARSHALNFHWANLDRMANHGRARDITATEPQELCDQLGLGSVSTAIDVIVGGPPCQAYSRVGRAKLRHLMEDPQAFRADKRRNLYLRYLDYVASFQPAALVMENVPDMLNQAGHNVVQEMVETLDVLGYDARYTLMNAANFGVPQIRDRVVLVAVHREVGVAPMFPTPSHHVVVPAGYTSSRGHALKAVRADIEANWGFIEMPDADARLPPPVTCLEGIEDLPELRGSDVTRNTQRLGDTSSVVYRHQQPGPYALLMRTWQGYETAGMVNDHVTRRLPRDCRIFAAMNEGAEYPAALKLAQALFETDADRLGLSPSSVGFQDLRKRSVPPYDPKKFSNKWWKMRRDLPVRTLLAHLGKDCYSHIHYDGEQARTLTVREAARLQSFPDGFQFAGSLNEGYQQIGNAVPPLMAAAIARIIGKALTMPSSSHASHCVSPLLVAA